MTVGILRIGMHPMASSGEWMDLFAENDLDLVKTSIVKHKIKIKPNAKPFKEWYHKMLPGVYGKVGLILRGCSNLGQFTNPQAHGPSVSILICKKGERLHFCIDLCKLNGLTIKDTYSIPWILITQDCLKGALEFTSLDLKSGEMGEASKTLITFAAGLLVFYECQHMPWAWPKFWLPPSN